MSRFLLSLSLVIFLVACGQPEDDTSADKPSSGSVEEYADRMEEEHASDTTDASPAVELGEVAPQPVLGEAVVYGELADRRLTGYLAYPESAHGGLPGILVFHEWWGLNDNIRRMAEKLAAQGYVVLAVDLYDTQVAETPQQARELMQQAMTQREQLNANIRMAYKFMDEEIGVLSLAALGWCMGGSVAMNAALLFPDQLDAAVIYYGHVADTSSEQLATLKMPLLGLFGAEDNGIPVAGVERFRDRLEALEKDATVVVYDGAGHAFANPTGQNYQAEAAEDAWERTLKFLDRTLNAAVNRNVLAEDELAELPESEATQVPDDDTTEQVQ